MNVRSKPCRECPWLTTTEPGQFPAERYAAIRDTTVNADGGHAGLGDPIFACHKSTEDAPLPCAGWLAAVGRDSVTVRVLVATGEIPVSALDPGDDWPDLFPTYDAMQEAQGG